mmetsp:Transcript_5627/g.13653  ORF Transcript_5627/g.13653 Transcript_5627/m.13653 type:complete len:286 (+) Transcript_5627:154-1011(+)
MYLDRSKLQLRCRGQGWRTADTGLCSKLEAVFLFLRCFLALLCQSLPFLLGSLGRNKVREVFWLVRSPDLLHFLGVQSLDGVIVQSFYLLRCERDLDICCPCNLTPKGLQAFLVAWVQRPALLVGAVWHDICVIAAHQSAANACGLLFEDSIERPLLLRLHRLEALSQLDGVWRLHAVRQAADICINAPVPVCQSLSILALLLLLLLLALLVLALLLLTLEVSPVLVLVNVVRCRRWLGHHSKDVPVDRISILVDRGLAPSARVIAERRALGDRRVEPRDPERRV